MNDKPYKSISCGSYDDYEVAILHKQELHLRWRDEEGGIVEMTLLPLDLHTEQGSGEYLIARDREGQQHRIRLDRILTPPPSAQ